MSLTPHSDAPPSFAARLQDWLRTSGLSMEGVAYRLGYSWAGVNKLRRGRSLPPPSKIPLWAREMGVPEGELRDAVAAERRARRAMVTADASTATNNPSVSNGDGHV